MPDTEDSIFRYGTKMIFHCVMEPATAVEVLQPFLYWELSNAVYRFARSYLDISLLNIGKYVSRCWSSSLRVPAEKVFYIIG